MGPVPDSPEAPPWLSRPARSTGRLLHEGTAIIKVADVRRHRELKGKGQRLGLAALERVRETRSRD